MARDALVIGINAYGDARFGYLIKATADAGAIANLLDTHSQFWMQCLLAGDRTADSKLQGVKKGKSGQTTVGVAA